MATSSRVVQYKLIYIKGSKNNVADALSRLDKIDLNKNNNNYNNNSNNGDNNDNNNNKVESSLESLCENFALNKEDNLHPTRFKTFLRFQQKDKSLIEIAKGLHDAGKICRR